MSKKNVLLCCGVGMSSGFLASEIGSYLQSIDCLLVGPHYATHLEDFKKQAEPYGVPVAIIPEQIYGMLDGEGLVNFAVSVMGL